MLSSPAKLIEMLHMQEALEARTNGVDWRSHDPNVTLAIHMECAEIIDQIGWKWWKDRPQPNMEQIHIELVDIWHFVLMHTLMRVQNEGLIDELGTTLHIQLCQAIEQASRIEDQNLNIIDLIVSMGYHMVATKVFPITTFVLVCEILDLSIDKLYELYLCKNVLNFFRQDHGYLDGTYKKQWFVNGKTMEDNEALMLAANRLIEAGTLNSERLASDLEQLYIFGLN